MFRSSSGPGLSISTSAANAFGSQTSNPPPSGGNKPFFGNTTSALPQTSSSLFNLSKPAAAAPDQNMQANQQTSNMGFNKGATTSLFGASQPTQPTQQSQGGGLFGSTFGQNQTQAASNPFGATTSNQTTTSLFGGTQSQPALGQRPTSSIFATSIGQQNQQASVPGVHISVNELRSTTRFNDLHEELQKVIEYVDAFIQNKIQWQQQCDAGNERMEDMCQQLSPDAEHCNKSLEIVQRSLENDAESIATAKKIVKADASDAQLSFKVINNLKLPHQFHHTNLWNNVSVPQQPEPTFSDGASAGASSRSLVEYFSKQADDMSHSLDSYKRNVAEVESYLKGMEVTASQQLRQMSTNRQSNVTSNSADDQVRELATVLREFESGILGVATQIGAAREVAQSVMLGSLQSEKPPPQIRSSW